MSAADMQAALIAALAGAGGIAGVATGIFDRPPARAAFPYITIGEGLSFDWSTKTERGREHRLAVTAWDAAGQSARLLALAEAIEAAVEGMGRMLPGGRVVSLVLVRSRVLRPAEGPWAAMSEWRARVLGG